MIILQLLAFVLGMVTVVATLASAIRSFVLPRNENVFLTRLVFINVRRVFTLFMSKNATYEQRDRLMALFAPVSLLILPVAWLFFVLLGYMFMFWALGAGDGSWFAAFNISGSSLLTLGFAVVQGWMQTALAFSEATIGLGLMALLIAYLPTMYSAFSKREALVNMLEVRAGSPPAPLELFDRIQRIHGWERLHEIWVAWEGWFAELEESHTSLAPLIFFRSPTAHRSWLTAAGAVLDSAALAVSTLNAPFDAQALLCIRAGYLALRSIADFFRFPYDPDPQPDDPISIAREEFDTLCQEFAARGIPLKDDLDQAWKDFKGWRVNYDQVLIFLAQTTMAPYASWVSDRSLAPHLQKAWRQALRRRR